MIEWSLKEFMKNFTQTHREKDIGDNIAIFYEESNIPIKINGILEPKLKHFKGSFCTYKLEENIDKSELPVEMIAIEEYSDSPYSIYIDENGYVDSYEFGNIFSITLGEIVTLRVNNSHVTDYILHRI